MSLASCYSRQDFVGFCAIIRTLTNCSANKLSIKRPDCPLREITAYLCSCYRWRSLDLLLRERGRGLAMVRPKSLPRVYVLLVLNYITYSIAIFHENACESLVRHSDKYWKITKHILSLRIA